MNDYREVRYKLDPTDSESLVRVISIGIDEANPSWLKMVWPVILNKIYTLYWCDDLGTGTIPWEEVDGDALLDRFDGTETSTWIDKGNDPEMGGQAPGDVEKRFYRIGVYE